MQGLQSTIADRDEARLNCALGGGVRSLGPRGERIEGHPVRVPWMDPGDSERLNPLRGGWLGGLRREKLGLGSTGVACSARV